jgi:hypothetical protein
MEGELDAAHVSFLHRRIDKLAESKAALTGAYFQEDTAPIWHVKNTDYGFVAASQRYVEDEKAYWRLNQFLLPFYTMITGQAGQPRMTRMWVPKDDTHCWVIAVNFRRSGPLKESELRGWKNGDTTHRKTIPGTTQPVETAANEYLIDRQAQKHESYTGIAGIRAQDAMATESAGAIADRTREHLGTSDIAIIAMRKRLLTEARASAAGTPPMPTRNGALYRVCTHQVVLDRSIVFDREETVLEALRA